MKHPSLVLMVVASLVVSPAVAATDSGSANCALVTQTAASGIASRIQSDDKNISVPQSVTSLSCLGNFFNGIGLNVVTNLLNPANLVAAIEGKICAAVTSTWQSMIGSVQCGLTITGFDLGFGGFGGGNFCPQLSFGGGGPTWGTVGLNGSASGGGVLINGSSMAPSGYSVPANAGAY